MQKTIFDVLTDKKARGAKVVNTKLDRNFRIGAPWLLVGVLY